MKALLQAGVGRGVGIRIWECICHEGIRGQIYNTIDDRK